MVYVFVLKEKLVRKGVIWYKNQVGRVKHKEVMADKKTPHFYALKYGD